MNILKKLGIERSVISPLLATGINMVVLFILYFILRGEYLLENYSYFQEAVKEGYIRDLLMAGPVFDAPGIFYLNILYIAMMLFPCHWKERPGYYKICKWVFVIINSIGIIANLADSIYFSYTLRRTTFDLFSEFAGDDNMGKIVGVELVRHWYLVLLAAVLIWGLWKIYSSPAPGANTRPKWRYYIFSILSLGAGALTAVSAIRGGFLIHWWCYIVGGVLLYSAWRLYRTMRSDRKKIYAGVLAAGGAIFIICAPIGGWRHRDIRPIAISNANKYIHRPNEVALVLNTPFTMIRTIGSVPFADPKYMPDAEMSALYTPEHDAAEGREGKKNVVVIILESFGREYIGSLNKEILGADYKGFAPFLDSLINVSATWRWSFDNGQKSIEGMPSALAGIPSFVKPFVLTSAAMNRLEGLPAILGREGYSTAFFHGARKGSMGFDGFAKSVGFSEYYGRESFIEDGCAGGEEEFDGYWGIWDEPFLQYFAIKLSDMKQPFMASLFTLSSHHPFNVPDKYKGKFPKGTAPIHQTIGYTDNALREFFATASRQPWYKNTIFVITNDHTNERCHDEYRSAISAFYGPIIIFDPSGETPRGHFEGIAQQIDIMPTVLGLTGTNRKYVAFGKDLFSTPAEEMWAVNYNGIYQYVKYGYVLQFDGKKNVGLFRLGDHKMERNLLGTNPEVEKKMQRELEALIQQYMQRMINDKLVAD